MITLLCPTRNRPGDLAEMYESARDTATRPNSIFIRAVTDSDDRSYHGLRLDGGRFMSVPRYSVPMSALWNVAWNIAPASGIYQMAADDQRFRTQGWDEIVSAAFADYPDRIAMVYGDTGTREGFGELPFISAEWTHIIGRFCPPYFTHNYADTWLNDVALLIGRHRYVPILTEHLRRADGIAPHDQTSLELEERVARDDMASLYASLEAERQAEADLLFDSLTPDQP